MKNWKDYTLGAITDYVNRGFSPKYVDSHGDIILNQKCIRNGCINYSLARLTDTKKPITIEKILRYGDILINSTGIGTAGRVAIYKGKGKATTDSHITIVRVNSKIANPIFVFNNLRQRENEIESYAEGSTGQIELGRERIKAIDILLPPLPEQHAIASVLSSLDDKIDLLYRQNKTLEAMAETLFRQWFVEEAERGWEEATLEQHIEVFRGLSYKGSGLTDAGLGLPMHNLNSVYEGGGYKHEGIKFYNGKYKERHLIYPGDIIVTNTEQGHEFKLIGFPAVVPNSFGNIGLFSQHIYKLTLIEQTYLSNEYIYYLLMSPFVREQIISATNGSTVNMLAIDGLKRPKFRLPPNEKVFEFSKIVGGHWERKNVNYNQICTLEKLRETLLSKLMSGEVRVEV